MALTLNTNIDSLTAQNNLTGSQALLSQSLTRLSSGLRINSAADDAAGLAIAQQFSTQINGTNQAINNANDAVSEAQTARASGVRYFENPRLKGRYRNRAHFSPKREVLPRCKRATPGAVIRKAPDGPVVKDSESGRGVPEFGSYSAGTKSTRAPYTGTPESTTSPETMPLPLCVTVPAIGPNSAQRSAIPAVAATIVMIRFRETS